MKKNCEDPESQSRWPILEFFLDGWTVADPETVWKRGTLRE